MRIAEKIVTRGGIQDKADDIPYIQFFIIKRKLYLHYKVINTRSLLLSPCSFFTLTSFHASSISPCAPFP